MISRYNGTVMNKNIFYFLSLCLFIILCTNCNFSKGIGSPQIKAVAHDKTSDKAVLIYRGPGACPESCSEAVGSIVTSMGYNVRYISPADLSDSSVFKNVLAWIQPGGEATAVAQALNSDQKKWLRDYVLKGGKYFGICAGAFFAGSVLDREGLVKGLGLLQYSIPEYFPQEPNVIPIYWPNKGWRAMYFEGGPFFAPQALDMQSTAFYLDGKVAAVSGKVGKGQIELTATHPEAIEEWLKLDNLTDSDGSDADIFVEILNRLLLSAQ